jgi:hypothetical protein
MDGRCVYDLKKLKKKKILSLSKKILKKEFSDYYNKIFNYEIVFIYVYDETKIVNVGFIMDGKLETVQIYYTLYNLIILLEREEKILKLKRYAEKST